MRRPSRPVFMISVLLVGLIIFGIALYGWNQFNAVFDSVPGTVKTSNLVIQPDETATQIGNDLQSKGLIRSALAFSIWARIKGLDTKLQAGVYKNISSNESISTIIDTLLNAKPDEIIVQIKEGRRIAEIANIFAQANLPDFSKTDFLNYTEHIDQFPDKSKYPLLNDVPAGMSMEGLLFPDTYYVNTDGTARDVVNSMLTEMTTMVASNHLEQAAKQHQMTTYQFLTLASIVEREAPNNDQDRKMIASVYWNRIYTTTGLAETGDRLQADPTVQYARDTDQPPQTYWVPLNDNPANIDPSSKWNTYVQTGWPPTPICSPGLKSLEAAADPAQSNNLYFFTDTNGVTRYASTNDQFNQEKSQYGVSQ